MAALAGRGLLFVLVCWLFAAPALGEEPPPGAPPEAAALQEPEEGHPALHASGSLRTDYFSSDKTLDDRADFLGGTAELTLSSVFSQQFDAKAKARLSHPDLVGGRSEARFKFVEGYLNWHGAQLDLRIGKQIVAWGRADAVNPTDNLTPRDFTVLLPLEENQRLGTVALKLDWSLTPEYTLELFATPFFEPSKIPLPIPAGARTRERLPSRELSDTEVGIKLNHTGGAVDWSLSFYHGYSLLPEIRLADLAPAPGLLLDLRYPQIEVVGADVARSYGGYGLRGEAAFVVPRDYDGSRPTVIRPYLFYVLGVDRSFFESLNVNLQLVGRWVQGYRDPESVADPVLRLLALNSAIIYGQRRSADVGFTLRVADRWFNDTLCAELLLVSYLNPANSYLRPLVSYDFTDRIKGTLGAELYSGPDDSLYGILKRNQGWFAELRYSF